MSDDAKTCLRARLASIPLDSVQKEVLGKGVENMTNAEAEQLVGKFEKSFAKLDKIRELARDVKEEARQAEAEAPQQVKMLRRAV